MNKVSFQPPGINAATERGQIAQIKSFLIQLVQQLNWAFSTLEGSNGSAGGITQEERDSIISEVRQMIDQAFSDTEPNLTTKEDAT